MLSLRTLINDRENDVRVAAWFVTSTNKHYLQFVIDLTNVTFVNPEPVWRAAVALALSRTSGPVLPHIDLEA
jgi:hypothetical protein